MTACADRGGWTDESILITECVPPVMHLELAIIVDVTANGLLTDLHAGFIELASKHNKRNHPQVSTVQTGAIIAD